MFDYIFPFMFLASGITANKALLRTLDSNFLVGIRMLAASIILLVMAFWAKKGDFLRRIRAHWPYLIILASFATFLPAILKAYALKHTDSSTVAFIGSLDPFLTAIYAYFLLNDRLTPYKWLGILLGIAGNIVLIITHSDSTCSLLGQLSCAEGAALAAVCVSRFGWIKVQQVLKSHLFSVKEINGLCMLLAGIYALGLTIIVSPAAFGVSWTLSMVLLFIHTTVIGNVLGFSLYSHLLKHHSATFVSLAGFSTPLFVYLFGWFFLNEKLYASFLLASAITFAGLVIFYAEELKLIRLNRQP